MELKFELGQKQILSQHMVQSMEILQMSAQELESYIEKLSLENPVIELDELHGYEQSRQRDDLQRKLEWLESTDLQNRVYYQQERQGDGPQDWNDKRQTEEDLKDYLLSQLLFSEYQPKERAAIEFMIQSLDDRGYFIEEIHFVAQYFMISPERAQKLLDDIQALDPAGVGARDLKECLLLQLKRRSVDSYLPEESLVVRLVHEYMDEIAKNHLHNIAKRERVSLAQVEEACEEIRSLNPKPGSSFNSREQLRYISPDAVVVKLEDKFEILINDYQYPRFSVSGYYQAMHKETKDQETKDYLRKKIQQAQWISGCIEQRSSTLLKVMRVLVEKQRAFFQYGVGYKSSLRLVDIAQELELHESTISRALRGKYLQCAWGVFPLNYFLASVAVRSEDPNQQKTPEQVKELIQQVVNSENRKKPYSDQAISALLGKQGVEISRRTVNKYRQEMGLPDKSGRKEWEA